jgi:glycosyltransferase involved in cell wall biosynthesis
MSQKFLPADLKSTFLVWGPPSYGPRSKVLSRELQLKPLHFIYSTTQKGGLSAPLKYSYQALKTLQILFSERPQIVFIQSPPSFAALFVYLYCKLTGARFLVDAHSAALQLPIWTKPQWLYSFLARQAVTTIVTNEHFQELIQSWGGHALILRDIPTSFEKKGDYPLNGSFNVVVVNTFSADEPLDLILEAAENLADIQFYVTGKKKMAPPGMLEQLPHNVQFTDFLPDESYHGLLNNAQAVMCLTTRNHTMQRGACEALSLGKPIITSDWPLLQTYFHKGTVHVANTSQGIREGVIKMREEYRRYQTEIKSLQLIQQHEWEAKVKMLKALIERSLASKN